jgi:hypothetical protein
MGFSQQAEMGRHCLVVLLFVGRSIGIDLDVCIFGVLFSSLVVFVGFK